MGHQDSKGQEMQTLQGVWQAFLVACQAAETSHPAKGALHHPTPWQQHKAFPGFGQLHHIQSQSLFFSSLSRLVTAIALIDKGDFNGFTGHFLNSLCQLPDLSTVLLIGGCDQQGQQMSQGVHCYVGLAAFASFGTIITGMIATFRAGLQVRLSKMAAVVCSLHPAARRSSTRKS